MTDRETLSKYLRKVTGDLRDARRRVATLERRENEPVAIVGMSCRYPGGVASPEELWQLVAGGRDAIGAFPADRGWDLERLYDPDPDSPDTCYARHGGFMADAAEFDAEFFSISPREAVATDPQQRLLLEASWEALEDAAIDPRTLHKTPTGVFAGVMYQDYGEAPGMAASLIPGRVAYALGLQGPAMTVDTACSSSLVAMHLAAQALRQGECSLALAGGVTVLSTPGMLIYFSRQRGLAPDGRSKSFADAADGAGWAEGVGVLVLERLSDAQRNGHEVIAVLRGSAVNQDGPSNGFTAPNGPSQERVIRQALANARLEPKDIDAVEAHGTGTTLGDPIEAGALLATYGQDREEPLRLGSIKSNIGHTQAAAGVAGVIKMVEAMRHGVLPKTLHVDAPSSKVDWEAGEVELLTEPQEWQPNGSPRRAGVSSFGASGTNAHVIVEEAPEPEPIEASEEQEAPEPPLRGTVALPLSAKTEPALREAAANLATHLSENPELDPEDVAFSLATTRALFERRGVITGSDREELLSGLKALSQGEPAPNVSDGKAQTGKLAYLLTGQGAQRAAMGKELYAASPAFAKALDEACEAIDPHLERPLKDLLFAKEGSKEAALLDETTFTQPALFAIEAALFRVLEQTGMRPDYLTGHSVGEISAAHISGVLSLEDAARLICTRAKLMGELPAGGAMVAIEATEQEVAEAIEGKEKELSIAAVNGPNAIVISGVGQAALEVQADFEEQGKKTKRLSVSHAFHSPLIEPVLDEFAKVAETLDYHEPQIPIVSNTSGELLTEEQATDPAYWVSHIREAVRFAEGIETLQEQGVTTFVELGPDAVLTAMATSCLPEGSEATLIPTLRRGRGEAGALTAALAQAHTAGAKPDWARLYPGAKRVPLPTYPFQRERYWLSAGSGPTDASSIGQGALDHPLLAARVEDPGGERLTLTGRISLSTHPWLADHAVLGTVILPGTAFVELALKAAEEAGCEAIAELTLQAPLVLSEQGAVSLQVTVAEAGEQGVRQISIHSRTEAGEEEAGEWVLHASGTLSPEAPPAPEPLGAWPPEGAEPVGTADLYERLAGIGFDYGPAFQGLTAAWQDGKQVYAEVSLSEEQREQAGRFAIHPALLDSAFHAGIAAALGTTEGDASPTLPFDWHDVRVTGPGASSLRVRLSLQKDRLALLATDPSGAPVVGIGSLYGRPVEQGQLAAQSQQGSIYRLEWQELNLPEPSEAQESQATLLDTRDWTEDTDPVKASHATAAKALELVQAHLAKEEDQQSRLVFLTEGALAAGESEPSLPKATLAGLLRSAHSEHPGRFALIDSDGSSASSDALPSAIAALGEEPQIALREGEALVPRLAEAKAGTEAKDTPAFDPEKTVLITGATGGLGALFARHLAEAHGARNLLLASRSGEKAKGATELQQELSKLGAKATIAACDVSDREQLEKLLDSIPKAHPLGAVIHAAGVFDNGLIADLDPERLDRVMAPKAGAAHHLHELTRDTGLSHFVLFSSSAGLLGGPGQGNYAAANSFLDALATKRRAENLPASSLAWGLWAQESNLAGEISQAQAEQLLRQTRTLLGFAPIPAKQGLELFDASASFGDPLLAPVHFDRAALRAQAKAGSLPAPVRGLVRTPKGRESTGDLLSARLATVPEAEREAFVLDFVRTHVAAVLGHDSAAAVGPEKAFKDLGFDSLAAVELRNRLVAATGVRLPATVVFDYPSAAALARHLSEEVSPGTAAPKAVARAQASEEPVAIVGMSCRYPGGVASPEELWQLVAGGRDAIGAFPADRGWDLERLYDPDPDHAGTSYTRDGGFLHDSADFDAEFFGISPREALMMDPQQRLLLEASWEALENAGLEPRTLHETQTGVFAGVMYQDYGPMPGMTQSLVSGRIAYTLGLEGPAMTVDTACSSSLVAMHLAAQALRSGECSLALAGGVTVLATPGVFVEFSRQRGLSPDGRSKSFSEAADGVGWAEGVGVLALERLSDARRNGHPVLAILKGSATNQDGASNGITAPNGPSQERVIRQALANARLEPKDIDAVEAHGTGTTLGDPIEAGALLATYGQDREEPLRLGSIKSNIGHTQAAAGVAGVIKMVEAMRHGVLPKTLHVDAPSSKVDWEAGEVELLTEPQEWQPNGSPRRAGVSSFGISGTNAHVIIEEAPAQELIEASEEQVAPEPPLQGTIALPLSAKTEPALREAAANLATHLKDNPGLDPKDIAFSLATTRALFEQRGVITGSDRDQLLEGLKALSKREPAANAFEAKARPGKLAYLLTGQGAQRATMGKELHAASPAFAKALDEACEAIDQHLERPLKDLLFAKEGSKEAALLDQTTFTQPALFAIEAALFRLTEQLGMRPDYLTGHSVGEISAAHISGVLSLEDAAKLICTRAKLMGELPKGGAMVAIEATEQEVAEAIEGKEKELSIAAVNGPTAIVISGVGQAALEIQARFEEQGKKTKRLAVSHAFHSPLIEPVLDEFAKVAETLDYQAPQIPIVSNTSGEILTEEQATDPAYWVSHVREAVRFAEGIETLQEQGVTTFVELGPDAVLTAMATSCLPEGSEATLIPTLRKGRGEAEALTGAIAQAHTAGAKPDWARLYPGAKRVPLPTYPFQRERFWLLGTSAGDLGAAGQKDADHPLLAAAIEDPEGGLLLTGAISLSTHPWLADHAVLGTVILPGTAFVELALKAAKEVDCEAITELILQAPLLLSEQGAVSLQVSVAGADEQGKRPISIHSRTETGEEEGEWTLHASGTLSPEPTAAPEPLTDWPPEGAEPVGTDDLYERLAGIGFDYGPAFQGLTAAWQDGAQIYAEVSLSEEQREQAGRFAIHPALFDSALHGALLLALEGEGEAGVAMPYAWSGISVEAIGALSARVRLSAREDEISIQIVDTANAPVAQVSSLRSRPVSTERMQGTSGQGLFEINWSELSLPEAAEAMEPTVIDTRAWAQGEDPVESSHAIVTRGLEQIQAHLAEEQHPEFPLIFLTEGALDSGGVAPSLPAAALAGLLRSAHSEHPGRFALIDTDGSSASSDALPSAIAALGEESQLALRRGEAFAPRLVEAKGDGSEAGSVEAPSFDPEKTILITGATGGLGALFACHLAETHGARNLLLASRSGEKAKGARELKEELEELGAKATIAACDVSDREQLEKLLASIPQEHPLGAVIHAAGVLDDATVSSMDAAQLERVLAPKADAAWHLHELSAELDLSHFILFSSIAAAFGGPGQGNYAAANSFLDALAAKRRTMGLPAGSIAWGLWQRESTMTAGLSEADMTRISRSGLAPISDKGGLELFDAAIRTDSARTLALTLNRSGLRSRAAAGALPPMLTGLVRGAGRRKAAGGLLAAKLAALPEAEREDAVLGAVRAEVAAVLGHESAERIDPERAFSDLGFDSLAAVELRNRLAATTGISLPATMAFDYPSSAALARHLLEEVSASGAARKAVARAQASEEPVAIVGMSCRYPGEVASPEELWQLVAEGRDGISEFPANRGWDLERLYDPDLEAGAERRTSYTREGGFLHDSAEFDAAFFGISPREALGTDPQQRLLLEASWQALEDAGIDPGTLAQTETGVFAGVMYQDYGAGAGMTQSLVSGRIAYTFGLEGPAMTVDTACSSSLVAMHLAAQALRSGECSLALAGGVTVLSTPGVFVEFSRQRGLSPEGRSKAFSESADGVGWAEGVGVLALERLSDAKRKGHRVLAILKGSATNQDGASNGITAPNGPSQERVIRQALANARLEPRDIDAVEAHGTGTILGDPIEAGALLATYGQDREEPLRLGSIKSNIGHTQAAAGVAGVIKMVEAMRHGVLPKTLHVDKPSSKVDWEAGEVELLTEPQEWQPNGSPRRAGVSSFGISGTNAHVIIEEAPEPKEIEVGEEAATPEPPLSGVIALPLSAKTEPALREAAANLATHLSENPELDPKDVAFSLATTRALFEQRGVITGSDREELLSGLKALSQAEPAPNTFEAKAKSGKLAYLLTGQGAQRATMGKELYAASPAFAKALDEACEATDPHLEYPLKELLFAEEGSKQAALLDQTTFTQPALFAIEAALFRALEQTGMRPDYLTGHSVGEISAAHISGVLSLKDAAKLICTRAKLMGELPAGGAMVAIEATEQEVAEAIEGKEKELSIAAVNGPSAIVISGVGQAALEIQARFEEQGKKTKRLAVSHAFHSPLIEPVLDEFAKVAETLDYQAPQIPIVSNTSGELLTEEQATDPAYWVSHVREAVRFAEGIETLQEQGVTTFVELGPDAVLTAMATSCLPEGSEATLIPTLRKGRGEAEALTGAIAKAHTAGAKSDWARLYPGAKRVPLPTYPFQRERYWLSSAAGLTDASSIGQGALDHPLLAARVEDPSAERLTLTGRISLSTHPWLADHAVLGTVILPGTAFAELALKAAEEAGCEAIDELTLQAPLVLPEQGAVSLQVTVAEAGEQGSRPITIHSRTETGEEEAGEWVLHASGTLSPEAPPAPESLGAWPPEGAEQIGTDDLYERLAGIGFDYGPAFQGLTAAWRDGEQIYAEVSLAGEQREQAGRFAVHPALFDSAFHAGLAVGLTGKGEGAKPTLPFDWHGVRVLRPGASSLRVRLSMQKDSLGLLASDPSGNPVVEIGSLYGRPVEQGQLAAQSRQGSIYRLDWKELSLSEAGESEATLLDTREWAEDTDPVAASHATAARALEQIQAHLAKDEDQQSRLVLLTEGALSTAEEEAPSLPAATLAGLLRSAHSEHPGRFALIDTDGSDASSKAIEAAIAASLEEPQIALREGEALVPRLAEAKAGTETEDAPTFDPEKTILVTGATGGLGALFARHLAEAHGARNLLLASRSGEKAKGARELQAELEELGAKATIAACDVSDPKALEELLASIPKAHPLGAVIHAAGVFDNGLIADLDPERLSAVMAPKADAAHHLHELTRETGLSHFVLFSSAAGLLGGPGQGNYAAANSFLDALAAKRRSQGLPSTSLAWGLWAQESNLVGEIGEAEIEQFLRQTRMLLGFAPIPAEQGLELFEASISTGAALLAPVHFDRAALRAQAKSGSLPALMRGLVRVRRTVQREKGWLLPSLASLAEEERRQALEEAIGTQIASALGQTSPENVEPGLTFPELGFDSLASLEMRDWLNLATGLSLPASMLFDYPTPEALSQYVDQQLDAVAWKAGAQPTSAGTGDRGQAEELVSIGSLYERAEALGRSDEGAALLAIAANLRQTFDLETYKEHVPGHVRLSTGSESPKLICVPSLLAVGGPHQYVKFAQCFTGKRNVDVVQNPGFLEGEQLPADLQVAKMTQAAAIQQCANGAPYVLVGHSTGGLFAHAIAEYLDGIGMPPDGVVKVDTYSHAGLADITPHALSGMKEREGSHFELTDHRLTAMVAYRQILEEGDPGAVRSAGLFVKATDPMPGMTEDVMRQARWDGAQTVMDVPGSHFTMMEEHVSYVAQAVDEWLSKLTNKGIF